MENLEIAIPSFRRPEQLFNMTLKLINYELKPNVIIYLNDEHDYFIYKNYFGNYFDDYKWVITNTIGIGNKRNFIKQNTTKKYLMMIDDDIKGIIDNNNCYYHDEMVKDLIINGFKECEEKNLHLWGVCCYSNSFYLKPTISTNLKFICGGFQGIITTLKIETPIDTFEDYFNTCAYFEADNGVLRYNYIGLKTNTFKEKGGLQSLYSAEERCEQENKNAFILKNRFGNMLSVINKKRGFDIRLNSRFKIKC
jgi:hypothetical protein